MLTPILKNCIPVLFFLCSTIATAQTSGPTQPEVQSFQSVSISKMVETSTGEFQYSIPLFTIGGYPININYNSRIGMENEASMVGLGFNLNCGAINRQPRGLPDDFAGDLMPKRVNMKPNITTGMDLGLSIELLGLGKKKKKGSKKLAGGISASGNVGIFYNNISGLGIERTLAAGLYGSGAGISGNAGIGINSNSQHGTSVNPYCGLSYQYSKNENKEKDNAWKETDKNTKVAAVKIKSGITASAGIGYDFNAASYNPKVEMPFSTVTLDFSLKAGFAGAYFQVGGNIRGYRITQKLQTNTIENPAYGFLYAEKGKNKENALMDFNREQDVIMTEDKPNLPLAYATPDVYIVAGQGVGGEFELKRNNVFIGFDPKTSTNSHNIGAEVEAGFGAAAVHVGAELRYGFVLNTSEKWGTRANKLLNIIDFNPVSGAIAEQTYFKNPSDVMFNGNLAYAKTNMQPIAPVLAKTPLLGANTKANEIRVNNTIQAAFTSADFVNNERNKRLDVIYYLTAEEASLYGVQKTIRNYELENFASNNFTDMPRVDNIRAKHHLSELICLKDGGMKYVFNMPAYNTEKRDISYSINEGDFNNYETAYIPNLSSVENNGRGKDDYISITETPAYAHSFLLGAVLSPNYIDVDDNGPSTNDIGDYVQFNYTRLYTDYYWRSNNDPNAAIADKGYMADKGDGKAFFSEGKKEVWYIHSVQSKKEEARFYYTSRTDAYDLKQPSRALQRLDSILIFSRPELNNANSVPFKRIYFDYNTATPLCKGINKNPALSKLTLNAVYFKDGSSNKGKHSAYKFEYDGTKNPAYNALAVDRWGNYKPVGRAAGEVQLDNKLFPFVNQDNKAQADANAASWLLKKITLPSGGKITIDYEAHDYAFVQDKQVQYMTQVVGITNSKPSSMADLGKNQLYSGNSTNDYLIFKLKHPIPANTPDADFIVQQGYFTDGLDSKYGRIINNSGTNRMANLYGKFRVSILPQNGYVAEDIPVFLDAVECGALKLGSNDYRYGFIKLSKTSTRKKTGKNANQISLMAWQFTKHTYPQILFGMDADPALNSSNDWKAVAKLLDPVAAVVKPIMQTGPNDVLKNKNVADNVSLEHSYIRLYVPDGYKYGGSGARVKSITLSDNWQTMTSGASPDANYTIQYEYTKKIGNKTISSGVASYEPEIGGEENPWKQPIFYKDRNFLMPDNNNFMMTPYGESLFPSASIVYTEVKTTQNPIGNPLTQTSAGYTVDKFYSYYDFPCWTAQTDIDLVRNAKLKFNRLVKNVSHDFMTAAQGYVVVTNDMHGKPKSEEVFGDKGSLVSGKYYKYKTKNTNTLNNYVKAIDKAGNISMGLLGVETQLYGDARKFHTESYSGSVHGNIDLQVPPPVPPVTVWPDFSFEKKTFTSLSLTKHVRQQGILDSVIAVDKGARVYTTNDLYDAGTGAVLLTSSNNEFDDPVYHFTYPAHWAYDGMGMASDNISTKSERLNVNATNVSAALLSGFKNNLLPGDVFGLSASTGFSAKYVVTSSFPSFQAKQMYSTAAPFPTAPNTDFYAKLITSGKKNLATTPVGSFTSLVNPVTQGNILSINYSTASANKSKVINADATEYSNKALSRCDSCTQQKDVKPSPANPRPPLPNAFSYYLNDGVLQSLAPWQAEVSYKYVEDRTQTSGTPSVRKDGYIANFWSFWQPAGSKWAKFWAQPWQFTEKINLVDSRLNPIETVNPLNIYNSVQQSNFDGLVHATTANARYHETLFDGFEDLNTACASNHYSIASNPYLLDNTTAHTGYYSMKTGALGYIKLYLNNCQTAYNQCLLSGASHNQCGKLYLSDSCKSLSILPNCEPILSLLPNKEYIISGWVKKTDAANTVLDYTNAFITAQIGSTNITCKPAGQIIDGWQRIEQVFKTPPYNNHLMLLFSANTNFDDVRIFPADGNMVSYVYSNEDYSPMAILDENNFATFYEYDQQKQLKRVKKETAKGIVTVQEVNFGSFKQ